MSSLFIEGYDVLYTPAGTEYEKMWHGFQTPLQGGIARDLSNVQDALCPVTTCGIKPDVEVGEVPEDLKAELGEDGFQNWKLILVDCRKGPSGTAYPVHVAKRGYTPHQHRLLAETFLGAADVVLGPNGYDIVSIGTVGGYSQFLMSLVIKGSEGFTVGKLPNGTDDTWDTYFGLNTSHNGLVPSQYDRTKTRRVCINTIRQAIAESEIAGTLNRMKHTPSSLELITPERFAESMTAWMKQGEIDKAMLTAFKSASMDLQTFKSFATGVFTSKESNHLSTTSFNRVEELAALFSRGTGNTGTTRYDALNAFTEYFHPRNKGAGSDKVNLAKRIANANYGTANEWKRKAVAVLADEELFADASKRGEILYGDKLTSNAAKN